MHSYTLFFIKWSLGPGQTGNVWRPNTIKHYLVTKHGNVVVSSQTVKICLIKSLDQTQIKQLIQTPEQALYACPHQTCLIRTCPNEKNIAHQTRKQKKYFKFVIECLMWSNEFFIKHDQHDQTAPNKVTKQFTKHCLMVFGHQTFSVCPGP